MKKLNKGFIQTLALVILASIGVLFFTFNKLGSIKDNPMKAAGGPYCSGVCAGGTSCRINGCKTAGNTVVEMIRYHCNMISPSGCGGGKEDDINTYSMDFKYNCGSEQIDAYGTVGGVTNGWAHIDYGQNCTSPSPNETPTPTPTPTPSPTSTPTPAPGRQDMCKSASISSANPAYGENITMSSSTKDGMTADHFSYQVYNLDNLYGPGNPKPVYIEGTTQLIFYDQNTTDARQSGSRTVSYASLFITDANNNNQPLVHAQINAYFQLGSNPYSLPEPNCVVYVNAAPTPTGTPVPTPTPIVTSTPTPTSSPTPTGSVTPTPTPLITPTPTPTVSPTPTPTVTPTPTLTPVPTPNWCNGTCGSNSNCQSGYFCYNGYCRIPSCRDSVDCICATPTPTPVTPLVLGATAPPVLPKTGGGMGDLMALFGVGSLGVYLVRRYRLI